MTTNVAEQDEVRIGVVSLEPLRAVGLQTILERTMNVRVETLTEAEALGAEDLAMLLLDAEAGEELLRVVGAFRRRRPELRVIVTGPGLDEDAIAPIIGAGARGYLAETANEAEIRMAFTIVLDGSVWAPRRVMARLLDAAPRADERQRARVDDFTGREREVLQLLTTGLPNKEIGKALGIDGGTVKAHVGRLMRKVNVTNRTALVLYAVRNRIDIQ